MAPVAIEGWQVNDLPDGWVADSRDGVVLLLGPDDPIFRPSVVLSELSTSWDSAQALDGVPEPVVLLREDDGADPTRVVFAYPGPTCGVTVEQRCVASGVAKTALATASVATGAFRRDWPAVQAILAAVRAAT